jgi:hypothetical protein
MSSHSFLSLEGGNNEYPLLAILFVWLVVTTLLGLSSGWYFLMWKYPDHEDEVFLRLKHQGGQLGRVRMSGGLNLSACRSGLRVGIFWLLGPFCRNFFVPWAELTVERKQSTFGAIAVLKFGRPEIGRLLISAYVANSLARSALGLWPEPGPFPEETEEQLVSRLTKLWLFTTISAALFFIVVPRLAHDQHPIPIAMAILLPALGSGLLILIGYLRKTRK